MKLAKRLSLQLTLVFLLNHASAQILFPSYVQSDYYDVLTMKNDIDEPINFRPSIINMYGADSTLQWDIWEGRFDISKKEGDFIQLINPMASFSYSSAYPDSYNDGAVWKGKGFNTSWNFGFTGRKGILHYTFAPVIYYAQNKDFRIDEGPFAKNQFQYPFEGMIDWVVRYGDQSVTQFHPGQSEIRLIYKNFTLGLSTQNMIWGPAQDAPILMSNNAGGIPHVDFGSPGPIDTKIGKIEYRIFWGMMDESDYFDDNKDSGQRYITGATFGYQPSFIPGLSIGLNRVLYREWFDGDLVATDLISSIWGRVSDEPGSTNDKYDQMFSLAVRWKFKEQGFDAYIEWARNDFPGTFTDFFENPERGRAVTMGMVKTFDLENNSLIRVVYEHTKLNAVKMSSVVKGHGPYYAHFPVVNGYTNNGQIMGAYIGPGSNAHHIRIQWFTPSGRLGVNFDRVRFNDDYIIDNSVPADELPADIRYRVGLDYLRFVGDFSLDANFTYGYRRNWYYDDDINQHNFGLRLQVGYRLNK